MYLTRLWKHAQMAAIMPAPRRSPPPPMAAAIHVGTPAGAAGAVSGVVSGVVIRGAKCISNEYQVLWAALPCNRVPEVHSGAYIAWYI